MIFDLSILDLMFVRIAIGLVFGLILGSFTTMLSYRLPRKLSIIKPRSRCPSCQTILGIPDLVPVFSWLMMKGRCRHCHAPIGGRYVLIETVTSFLVASAFAVVGFHWPLLLIVPAIVAAVAYATIRLER